MVEAPITLKTFFSEDAGRPMAELVDTAALAKAAHAAAGDLPKAALPRLRSALAGALEGLFETRLEDILQTSWGRLEAVRAAIEATRTEADGLVVTPLMDHRITSRHAPHIDLLWADRSLCRLDFDIVLDLELRGVQLEFRRGAISALTAGACLGEADFAFAGRTLIRRATPPIALPGRLIFPSER